MDERYFNGIPVVTKMKHDFKELPVFVCQDNTLYMLQTFRPLNHTETAFFYVDIGKAIDDYILYKEK